jgi:hypothetical protein
MSGVLKGGCVTMWVNRPNEGQHGTVVSADNDKRLQYRFDNDSPDVVHDVKASVHVGFRWRLQFKPSRDHPSSIMHSVGTNILFLSKQHAWQQQQQQWRQRQQQLEHAQVTESAIASANARFHTIRVLSTGTAVPIALNTHSHYRACGLSPAQLVNRYCEHTLSATRTLTDPLTAVTIDVTDEKKTTSPTSPTLYGCCKLH